CLAGADPVEEGRDTTPHEAASVGERHDADDRPPGIFRDVDVHAEIVEDAPVEPFETIGRGRTQDHPELWEIAAAAAAHTHAGARQKSSGHWGARHLAHFARRSSTGRGRVDGGDTAAVPEGVVTRHVPGARAS